jgi:four helix bundle protein
MEFWSNGVMTDPTKLHNKNRGYMQLIVWQRAIDLFELVFRVVVNEAAVDFKLRSQLIDAAQSVSANIAEGYGRRFASEYIQFLYYSMGSLGETMTRAIGLRTVGIFSEDRFREFDELHYEVENRLARLIEKLEQKKDNDDWISRISEDPEEYRITPSLHHSITPSENAHA